MRWALLAVAVLSPFGAARAQAAPDPAEILIESTGPEARHGDRTTVPLPPPGPGRTAFLREFLTVNVHDTQVTRGGRSVSAWSFYNEVGRTDLAARADERTRQRVWLMAGGGLVAVAGVVTGLVVMSNAQNTNDPSCWTGGVITNNACIDRNKATTSAGVLILVASIAVGTGLITWGALIPEMVTTPEETVRLATDRNLELSRKHGASGVRLRILPGVGPGQAGLTARLTF